MSSRRTLSSLATATIGAALLAATLAGCSALAPDGKVQSCLALQKPLTEASGKIQSAVSSAQSDPQGAVATLKEVHDDLEPAFAKIKNADVKKSATDANAALDDMTAKLEATLADPTTADPAALQTSADTTQKAFAALVTECTPSAEG